MRYPFLYFSSGEVSVIDLEIVSGVSAIALIIGLLEVAKRQG